MSGPTGTKLHRPQLALGSRRRRLSDTRLSLLPESLGAAADAHHAWVTAGADLSADSALGSAISDLWLLASSSLSDAAAAVASADPGASLGGSLGASEVAPSLPAGEAMGGDVMEMASNDLLVFLAATSTVVPLCR